MADDKGKVMEMVRGEIEKNPAVSSQELYEKAKKMDKSIGSMSIRQFHARFPLQVKRQRAGAGGAQGGARPRRSRNQAQLKNTERANIRAVLLDFARAVAAADGTAQVVDVITAVDDYVDRVVRATGRK